MFIFICKAKEKKWKCFEILDFIIGIFNKVLIRIEFWILYYISELICQLETKYEKYFNKNKEK